MTRRYRSKLFVPGNRPALFQKALASGADAISIDLEDAVPAGEKARARQLVADFLNQRGPRAPAAEADVIVRLNGRESGLMIEDVLAVVMTVTVTAPSPSSGTWKRGSTSGAPTWRRSFVNTRACQARSKPTSVLAKGIGS